MNIIQNHNHFKQIVETELNYILFFSDGACNVGNSLEPKVYEMVQQKFPKLNIYSVFASFTPEVGAQLSIFAIPTVCVYFDGKLTVQKSRVFGLGDLEKDIERYYRIMFEE